MTLQRYRKSRLTQSPETLKGRYQEKLGCSTKSQDLNQGRSTKVVSGLFSLDKGLEFVGTMKSDQCSDTEHKEAGGFIQQYIKSTKHLNSCRNQKHTRITY